MKSYGVNINAEIIIDLNHKTTATLDVKFGIVVETKNSEHAEIAYKKALEQLTKVITPNSKIIGINSIDIKPA